MPHSFTIQPDINNSYLEDTKQEVKGHKRIVFHTVHSCFTDIKRTDKAFNSLKKLLELNGDSGNIINHIMETLNKDNSVFNHSKFEPNMLLVEWADHKKYALVIKKHAILW
jgi:hypothetical protein